jgi:hypothetical protein
MWSSKGPTMFVRGGHLHVGRSGEDGVEGAGGRGF